MKSSAWMVPVGLLAAAALAGFDGTRIMQSGKQGAPEVGGYTVLLAVLLAGLTLAWWIKTGAREPAAEHGTPRTEQRKVWTGLALLAVYVAALDVPGYVISTVVLMIVFLRLLTSYRWVSIVIGALAMAGLSAWGLATLDSPMPRGIFY